MADSSKHGKKAKGSRHNRKLIVKEILKRFKNEGTVKVLPFLVLLADYFEDGQIDGFGILGEVYSQWVA